MKEWYVMEKNIVLLDIKPLMGINGTGLIAQVLKSDKVADKVGNSYQH